MQHEEKVILQLSLKLPQLLSAGDATGLAALFDDELEAVDANGSRLDKARAVQRLLQMPLQGIKVTDIRITLFGDTALATGLLHLPANAAEQLCCYSQLWLRRGEHWRLRGLQLTPRR